MMMELKYWLQATFSLVNHFNVSQIHLSPTAHFLYLSDGIFASRLFTILEKMVTWIPHLTQTK